MPPTTLNSEEPLKFAKSKLKQLLREAVKMVTMRKIQVQIMPTRKFSNNILIPR